MTVWLEADVHLPGWEVQLTPTEALLITPGEMEWFTMTVTPPPGPLPPDNVPIVDVRAMTLKMDEPHVLGGFRKLYRPPVPEDIVCRRELHERLDAGLKLPLALVAIESVDQLTAPVSAVNAQSAPS